MKAPQLLALLKRSHWWRPISREKPSFVADCLGTLSGRKPKLWTERQVYFTSPSQWWDIGKSENPKVADFNHNFIKKSMLMDAWCNVGLCSVMLYTTEVERWRSHRPDLVTADGGHTRQERASSNNQDPYSAELRAQSGHIHKSEAQLQQKDSTSWEMLSLEDALNVLDSGAMESSVDVFIYLLQECRKKKDLGYAKRVHFHIRRTGLEAHNGLSSYIIPMFVECGSIFDARQLFDRLTHRDEQMWTSLILGYIQCGQLLHALNLYQEMQDGSVYTGSNYTLVALLKACAQLKEMERGREIHVGIIQQGYERDLFVGSTLVDMYAKCGFVSEAHQVFDKLPARNVVTWNALITGYAQRGLSHEVLRCLGAMQFEGVSPNAVTFICALKACCSSVGVVDKGREVHNEIVQMGFERDLFVGSTLVDAYAKNGSPIEAQEVFDKLPVRDIVSWMALVAGYAEHGPGQGALKCFQQMQLEGICPDAAIFACVLKACGCIGAIHRGREIQMEIIRKGFETDPFVSSTLVDMYAKCGSLSEAREVFDKLPDQNVVSLNALLVGYTENGTGQEALKCFQHAQGALSPNAVTFSSILKALGSIGSINEGREVHREAAQKGFENDLFVGNSLVDMYAKCGSVLEAQKVFDKLQDRSVVSWTALIGGYAEHGPGLEALNRFEQMELEGLTPDAALFTCVLKACSSIGAIEKGKEIHKVIAENGFERDLLVGNSLVDMYAKCGSLAGAQEAFDKLPVRNVVSWTTLISVYAEHGLGQEALKYFEQMQLENVVPDAAIFACALKACCSIVAFDKGQEIHNEIIQRGLESDLIVGSSVVDIYAKGGSLLEAQSAFDKLEKPNSASWNALITGYAEHGCDQEASKWFEQMQLKGICPDEVTYVSVLKACGSLDAVGKGHKLHREIIQKGLEGDSFIGNTLVNMYAKCGVLLEAQEVFDKLRIRSVVSWNALIAGYSEYGPNHEALNCYEHMQLEGVYQTVVSFVCGLKACGNMGAIDKGREIHEEITQVGWETDISITSTLVDMYAKCGSLLEARQVFDTLSVRDVVAWNAMIKGYGLNHDGDMAVQFFADMQEQGVQPNTITFLCLLTACSHNSLVLKGQEFFKMMKEKYSITPSLDHFSCMVDLFARSGRLFEADKFLETLPCSPSKDIWLPLLSACKTYAEVDLGHKCFQQLVNMNPDCAASYVLMSSIYASAGRWDEVARIEEMRKHAGAEKPASAFIEGNDKMYEFVVGENQKKEALAMLEILSSHIEEEGHMPNLDLVLRPMSDEDEEAASV